MRRRCPMRRQARLRLHHRCGKDRPLSMAFGVRNGADAAEGTKSFGCACSYRKTGYRFSGTCAKACCRSSVVEHSLGKGEVDSSILSGSTIRPLWFHRASITENPMTIGTTPAEIVTFWREAGPDKWFEPTITHLISLFDRDSLRCTRLRRAAACGLGGTAGKAHSRLCFCSTSFRATCFAAKRAPLQPMRWPARWPMRALAGGFDQATDSTMRPFFYLPFMHSEALVDQDRCVRLYEALGDAEQLRYAGEHRDVIENSDGFRAQSRARPGDDTSGAGVFGRCGGLSAGSSLVNLAIVGFTSSAKCERRAFLKAGDHGLLAVISIVMPGSMVSVRPILNPACRSTLST